MLSVIIITRNEQDNIVDCLRSVENVADEIIVIDSYSTDNTVRLVKKFSKKIFLKHFNNDGAEQRNFALSKTKGDWILSIDADERLSNFLVKEIPILIKSKKLKGYLIPRRNYINKNVWLKHGLFYPDYQLRLFRKDKVKFIHPLHTYPNVDEKYVKKIKAYFIHNSSRTKYDSFCSILRLFRKDHNHIRIQAIDLLSENKSLVVLFFLNIKESIRFFINGFFRGKGFLDGWKGFRAAVIFSMIPILVVLYAILIKLRLLKIEDR